MYADVSIKEIYSTLGFEILEPGAGSVRFDTHEISRPGLQFTGFYEDFAPERAQLIGAAEMAYLYSLPNDKLNERMASFMSLGVPCIVCSRNNNPPKSLLEHAKKNFVTVFKTDSNTDKAAHDLSNFIQKKLAPRILVHGELMDVYGIGVLIRGESGMGKSETAVNLIQGGHRLVADDVVEILRIDDKLIGRAPELTKHIVDIRGIGLIDVRYLYGMGSILDEKSVDFVIDLETLEEYNKQGRPDDGSGQINILDMTVPNTTLPVSPGRNVALLIEVAVRNFRLKNLGYDTKREFERRLG